MVSAFIAAGAKVSSLDIGYDQHSETSIENLRPGKLQKIYCDITNADSMREAWSTAISNFGVVESCVALAGLDLSVLPQSESICDMEPSTWARVLETNIGGTMLTAQSWLRGIRSHHSSNSTQKLKNPSIILIGSEAGHFGVRTQAAYAASKSAVQYGLLQSLRADTPRVYERARCNAVAPGPVDTPRFRDETNGVGTLEWWTECEATTALRRPVPAEAVARTVLFLASERWSSNVHGQVVNVDSGKQGSLMWAYEGEQRIKVLQDG